MDAIRMLKDDHKAVEQLFKRFEKAGDRAFTEKRAIVDRIIEDLSKHAAIEEQLFYPVVRATVPGTDEIALESLEEHHVVKWVLSELDSMDPRDERFDAKVTVLMENVRHHVKEEEQEFFPEVRNELGRTALDDLGNAMEATRKLAPTHPHPRSPDTPPGNLLVGTAAGVVDRLGDTVSGVAQGGVTAITDLIAVILGRKRPSVSPRGSKVTRTAASKVRSGASSVTDSAIEAVENAQRTSRDAAKRTARTTSVSSSSAVSGAKRTMRSARAGVTSTARAASSGAKGTSTSARRSMRGTVTTAKRASTTTGRTARAAARNTTTTAKRATKRTASTAKRTATQSAATNGRSS